MGIPEIEAKRYEGKVKGGNSLISVHAENSDREKQMKDAFEVRATRYELNFSSFNDTNLIAVHRKRT